MPAVAGSKGTEMKFFPSANTSCLRTTVLRQLVSEVTGSCFSAFWRAPVQFSFFLHADLREAAHQYVQNKRALHMFGRTKSCQRKRNTRPCFKLLKPPFVSEGGREDKETPLLVSDQIIQLHSSSFSRLALLHLHDHAMSFTGSLQSKKPDLVPNLCFSVQDDLVAGTRQLGIIGFFPVINNAGIGGSSSVVYLKIPTVC